MSRTTQVGDSLTVGMDPYFKKTNFDARGGRSSTEGLAVLKQKLRPRDDVVVFDLGTNDATAAETKRNLRRAKKLVGNRRLIVSTVNGPDAKNKNKFIKEFAAKNPNVDLVRGRRFANAGDGIHSTSAGYKRRAAAIKKAIRSGDKPEQRMTVRRSPKAVPEDVLTEAPRAVPKSLRELLMAGYSGR